MTPSLFRIVVLAFATPATLSYTAQPETARLGPDQSIERHIDRHEEHRYQLAMSAGECAHLTVDQRGIDVVIELLDTDGSAIARFQEEIRPRGDEQVEVVADRAGTYTLAVKAADGVPDPVDSTYAIHITSRAAATDADRAAQRARKLMVDAERLETIGKFDDAKVLFEQALSIAEGARGPDDVFVTSLVYELAGNTLMRQDNVRSEALFQRVIASTEKRWGADHPMAAMARSRIGLLYERAGQGPKAEALIQQALEVIEKTLGTDHTWYARVLVTHANLRVGSGDLEKAEAINRRALAITEKNEQTETLLYGSLLNNLGDVYRQKEDYATAEDYFQRALALEEKLHGPESYAVSIMLQNLGIVARERKEYQRSIDYYTRSLRLRERAVGTDHPDYAQVLMNLANVYHAMGDDAKALDTYFKALPAWEHSVGPYHRGMLTIVGNIARTYASSGDLVRAIEYQRRVDAIIEKQFALNLTVGSERQKQAFVNSMAERTHRTISLHLIEAPDDPDAGALAALVLLQRKGRVLDAMQDAFATVRQRVADSKDQDLLDQLRATSGQLARVALSVPEHTTAEEHQQQVQALEEKKEQLEASLSADSAAFRAQMQPVTLPAVQAAMPGTAALLEFAVFRPFDPKAERNAEAYAAPHYAVYVIRKDAAPRGVDLGPVKEIDGAIEALRDVLRDPTRSDFRQRARAVDDRIMRPLRASIGSATTRLLISPDGDLNLVPFEALIDEQGRYLVERYAISYLTSGRDLLRMQLARANQSPPVIFANPLFGGAPSPRSITSADDMSTMYFAPLVSTAAEARAIKSLFPDAMLLTGPNATKVKLQQLQAPRLLHIASHGFFLEDLTHDTHDTFQTSSGSSVPPLGPSGTRAVNASVKVDNPLLRSGLALAGANLNRGSQHDDGILTALEASSLNLWGTKLVTLSACDTGLGEVRNGEGVYGLRRAFVLAGAETLVMSLWPVSDYVTREIMTNYYTGLRAGLGRGDALRHAQLAMLKRKGRQHPFYWAGFIQSGEWANLDGKRER